MTSLTSIAFGESLIDEYPDRRVVAGAPLHVAIHLACAGWHSMLWSRVGADQDGEEIRSTLLDYGVDSTLLQTDGEAATGTVGIEMPERGEHSFTIRAPSAWDHIEPTESLPGHDVFYYGTLAARHPMSANTLWHGLEVSRARFRIFDVNLRPPYDNMNTVERGLRHATLVKMNSDEFEEIRLALGFSKDPIALFGRYGRIDQICITRGRDGAELHSRDGGVESIEPAAVNQVDSVGAGDAFTAGLSIALVEGDSARRALERATERAASVLEVRGGLPPLNR